jgi:hypothetical protein
MSGWLGRLKPRHVVRVTTLHAVVGHAIVQVANNLLPALNLPRWIHTLLVLLYLAGFPLVATLARALGQDPRGTARDHRAPTAARLAGSMARRRLLPTA